MKIAFLSQAGFTGVQNAPDTAAYAIYLSLRKKYEVDWIGKEELTELHRFHAAMLGNTPFTPEKYALPIGKLLSDKLQQAYYDLLVCPDYFLCAYLDTDIPVIYISDLSCRLSEKNKGTQDSGIVPLTEELKRRAVERAHRIFYPSEQAKNRDIQHYQADPQKMHVIGPGTSNGYSTKLKKDPFALPHASELAGIQEDWSNWLSKAGKIFNELFAEKNDTYIPVYIINRKDRAERKAHILNEFKGKTEFDITLVEACTHENGALGLWNSIIKVIGQAQKNEDDIIIICEDDHYFTEHYSPGLLWKEIREAYKQGADLLSGGIGGFGHAVPVGYCRYWVDWLWCTQFVVLYKHFFETILAYEFKEGDTADGIFSTLSANKLVIYPFISEQRDFGYSDVTQTNKENQGRIREHFAWANRQFKMICTVQEKLTKMCGKNDRGF